MIFSRMLCVDRLNKHNYSKSFDTRINFEFIKFYINMTGLVPNERLWGAPRWDEQLALGTLLSTMWWTKLNTAIYSIAKGMYESCLRLKIKVFFIKWIWTYTTHYFTVFSYEYLTPNPKTRLASCNSEMCCLTKHIKKGLSKKKTKAKNIVVLTKIRLYRWSKKTIGTSREISLELTSSPRSRTTSPNW